MGCGQGAQEEPGAGTSAQSAQGLGVGATVPIPLPPCSQVDRLVALARMRQSGAFLSTSEGLILQLVGDSAHPQFKEVLVPDPPPSMHLANVFSAPTTSGNKYIQKHTHIHPGTQKAAASRGG